ncbi:MAG TPA: archease [Anaerolineales bacterium]|nr:archease [Anaerolineales bacterium]
MMQTAGYYEVEHTADWALTVYAPDLAGLLEQAARGMSTLSGTALQPGPRGVQEISITGYDPEHLLVKFLTEILHYEQEEYLGFEGYDLTLEDLRLTARLTSAPIESQQKEIKAVTYHNLQIQPTPTGLETTIVFDV